MSQPCDLLRVAQQNVLRATRESGPSGMQQIAFIDDYPTKINIFLPDFDYANAEYNKIVDYYKVPIIRKSLMIILLPREYKYAILLYERYWIFAKDKSILEKIVAYEKDINQIDFITHEIHEEPEHYIYRLYFIYIRAFDIVLQFTSNYDIGIIENICVYGKFMREITAHVIDDNIHNFRLGNRIVILHMEVVVDFKIYKIMDDDNRFLSVVINNNTIESDNVTLFYEFTRQNKIAQVD